MGNTKVVYSGPSFCSLLFLLFLTLKLTGVISWSWWLVTMPLWAGLVIVVGIVIFCLIIAAVALIVEALIK